MSTSDVTTRILSTNHTKNTARPFDIIALIISNDLAVFFAWFVDSIRVSCDVRSLTYDIVHTLFFVASTTVVENGSK